MIYINLIICNDSGFEQFCLCSYYWKLFWRKYILLTFYLIIHLETTAENYINFDQEIISAEPSVDQFIVDWIQVCSGFFQILFYGNIGWQCVNPLMPGVY